MSGRYNLATTSVDDHDTDAGADFFIRGACIDLDLETEHSKDLKWYEETWIANSYSTSLIQKCRSIKEVWFEKTGGELVQLVKKALDELYVSYPKQSAESVGALAYWAPNVIHRDPVNSSIGDDIKYMGIICMPPLELGASVVLGTDGNDYKCSVAHTATTDNKPITGGDYADYWEALTTSAGSAWAEASSYLSCKIKIYGKFHSKALSSNTDTNYWSENYPNLLVMAALRNLEGFYRNTQGYNDYDRIVKDRLIEIDSDLVGWIDAEEMQMEG